MDPASTLELVLTRLWYLIGEWEGTGKGPDFRFRARATYSWILSDHFITGHMKIYDLASLSGSPEYFSPSQLFDLRRAALCRKTPRLSNAAFCERRGSFVPARLGV